MSIRKINLIIGFFVFHTMFIFSQDFIVTKSNSIIGCKVISEDTASVYFTMKNKGRKIKTFISKSDIQKLWLKDKPAKVLCKDFITKDHARLKPGIYKTFEEFKYNCPFVEKKYSTELDFLNAGLFPTDITAVKLNISKEEADALGKIFGYCDGLYVYILDGSLSPRSKLVRMEFVGRYCIFDGVMNVVSFNGRSQVPQVVSRMLDVNNGEQTILDRSVVREILAHDPELSNKFEEEDKKGQKLKNYIIKYAEKHKEEVHD